MPIGTPNSFLEALACNTPSVGTPVGGIPDILSNGVGIIIPSEDEDALFKSIKDIFEGEFSINQERRKNILEKTSMKNVGKKLKSTFKSVLMKSTY